MRVTIVGAGPRGLAVAIYALHKGLEVTLVDPNPLDSWANPYPEGTLMRSPITFDLVSFLPYQDFSHWRLDTFLGCTTNYNTQKDAEHNEYMITRKDFIQYLEYCLEGVLNRGARLIKDSMHSFSERHVRVSTGETINSEIVVLAIGACTKHKLPVWINSNSLYDKLLPLNLAGGVGNKRVVVIGSGQSAAEYSYLLLRQGCTITRMSRPENRIERYPVPTYKDWGPKTALGSFYRTFRGDTSLEEAYLREVKAWQPSLTPEIVEALSLYQIKYIDPISTAEVVEELEECDYILSCTGPDPSIRNIPNNEIIHPLASNPNFPLLIEGFRTRSNIHFTGLLASRYDGPRQGSVISAGTTAREIIESRINDNTPSNY